MKKIAKLTGVMLMLMIVLSAVLIPATATGESNLTIRNYGDFAAVLDCVTTASGVIDIPSEYEGVKVTHIGERAFSECVSITQINIPSSVVDVGVNAFEKCDMLATVVFEGENCTIGSSAFSQCTNLKSVTLPSALKKIPDGAFSGCASITEISIPDTVNLIGKEAFSSCNSIKKFNIPASVNVIRENAFIGCDSVTAYNVASENELYSSIDGVLYGPYKSPKDEEASPVTDMALIRYPNAKNQTYYTVDSKTKIISDYAFGENKYLTKVTLPNGLESIADYGFYMCEKLSNIIIPSTVVNIGSQAFSRCSALKSITIPASVENFESAFYMSGLESVIIENGVKIIGVKSFEKCTSLKSVSIPASVETIGIGAFYGCTALETLSVPSTVKTINRGAFQECDSLTLLVDSGSAAHTYAQENDINCKVNNLPEDPTDVPTTNEPTTDEPTTEKPTEPTTKPPVDDPSDKPSTGKEIKSISIQNYPKTEYIYKDKLDTSGLTLTVRYTDGTSETVSEGFTVSPQSLGRPGNYTITVSYQGFTDVYVAKVSYAWWQMIIVIFLLGFLWY